MASVETSEALARIAVEVWHPLGLFHAPGSISSSSGSSGAGGALLGEGEVRRVFLKWGGFLRAAAAASDPMGERSRRPQHQRRPPGRGSSASSSPGAAAAGEAAGGYDAARAEVFYDRLLRPLLWRALFNATQLCVSALEAPADAAALALPVPLRYREGADASSAAATTSGGDAGEGLTVPVSAGQWAATLLALARAGYGRAAAYAQTPGLASPAELLLALLWLTRHYRLLAAAEYVCLSRRYPFLLYVRPQRCPNVTDADAPGEAETQEGASWRLSSLLYPRESESERPHAATAAGGSSGATRTPRAGTTSSDSDSDAVTEAQVLLHSFPYPQAWPPAHFSEAAAIAYRRQQIARLAAPLGLAPVHARAPAGEGGAAAPPASRRWRAVVALSRLAEAALERAERALGQQAEQASRLGLHGPSDLLLAAAAAAGAGRSGGGPLAAAYEVLVEGLAHAAAMEPRTRQRLAALYECGAFAVAALRLETPLPSEGDVRDSLEEDAETWEGAAPAAAGGVAPEPRLDEVLSAFRALRARQELQERWRQLRRRARIASGAASDGDDGNDEESGTQHHVNTSLNSVSDAGGGGSNSNSSSSSAGDRFALSASAQARERRRIHDSARRRYSLQAALAAELRVSSTAAGGRDAPSHTSPAAPRPRRCAVPCALATRPPHRFAAPLSAALHTQACEVGAPAAGSTTSAREELQRLRGLLQTLAAEEERRAGGGTAAAAAGQRQARCRRELDSLVRQYKLRPASASYRRRTSKAMASTAAAAAAGTSTSSAME